MSTLISDRTARFVYEPSIKTWDVTLSGLDMGGKVTLHAYDGRTVVLKVAGHSAWVGLGMQPEYVPAHFLVFRDNEPLGLSKEYSSSAKLGKMIAEFPVKGHKA